ncbi:MAG: lamin tail domain-containing protein, partial [Solirubrobacteraceae bacterium]|nr:lamin tail domain-containing protein [Solirubrobacteraceae bacterium]
MLASLAFLAPLTVGASAASAAIVINEVESNAPAGGSDWVELLNTGNAAVAIGDYSLRDSGNNNNNRTLIPLGTTLNPGQYLSFDVNGLGNADSARLFDAADPNTPISTVTWSREAAATIGRCPDGTGETTTTLAATRDLSNSGGCAVTSAWPGSPTITEASVQGIFGPNMSGLVYQASGTAAPGVLWAVQNGPSRLYRLIFDGTRWVNDTANGWASGKQLLFPDGTGVPDAEGVTLAAGDTNGIFVSIERDDSGANANTSRPSVLRYDTSSAGAVLTATREWPLAADLPGLDPNAGLEAVSWVPDSYLVAKGFKDESTGTTYNPATYAGHGTGIFFVGVEQTGQVIGYALNQNTNAATRVATISGVYPAVMDLSWDAEK